MRVHCFPPSRHCLGKVGASLILRGAKRARPERFCHFPRKRRTAKNVSYRDSIAFESRNISNRIRRITWTERRRKKKMISIEALSEMSAPISFRDYIQFFYKTNPFKVLSYNTCNIVISTRFHQSFLRKGKRKLLKNNRWIYSKRSVSYLLLHFEFKSNPALGTFMNFDE